MAQQGRNPFLELQEQRLREGGRTKASGVWSGLGDAFGPRRAASKQWMEAWRVVFGLGFAGYSVGLDAWFPLRDQLSAAEFIERYVPKGRI